MRRSELTLLAGLAAALGGCEDAIDESTGGGGGAGGGDALPIGCQIAPLEAGRHAFTLDHGGLSRSYNLYLPAGYDGSAPAPLVLNFHGFSSNAQEQEIFSAMDATADAHGFAVAYPEGVSSSWNAGEICCGEAAMQGLDDVGFARALVAHALERACIDEKRVYSTGMSNGGFLSHRLGCEAADFVAAIAPVAGVFAIPPAECQPSRPMPIIHFYGTADDLVSYDFVAPTQARWLELNGCSDEVEVSYQEGTVTCETHPSCEGGVSVTLCSAEGMGHCWPGQSFCPFGASTTDISADEEMWKLFEKHSLP
jgi:polyhydroxybutyrate depolymerase